MNELYENRKQNTALFLRSYEIQKKMSTVSGFDEDEDMRTPNVGQLHRQNPCDPDLRAGQIRLLSQLERITYVVLLRRWEEDSFVVMTFSHYDFPANDEEFKPEFDGGMYLNTLQAWNTRTLQDETLKKSWLIGVLPDSDCSDAWDFWEHILTGRDLRPELLKKTGTPITSGNDPRIEYIQEELALFDELDEFELAGEVDSATLPSVQEARQGQAEQQWFNRMIFPELWEQPEEMLAAGAEKSDLTVECTPYGCREFVTIVYSPREKVLRVNIYLPDQSESSSAFDAWELISEDRTVLGTIHDGFCQVRDLEAFDGKCALQNPTDGSVVIFERISG